MTTTKKDVRTEYVVQVTWAAGLPPTYLRADGLFTFDIADAVRHTVALSASNGFCFSKHGPLVEHRLRPRVEVVRLTTTFTVETTAAVHRVITEGK